jgi:hypothetical protein
MADVEAEKARLRQQIDELRALKQVMAASAHGPATLGSLVLDVFSELVDAEVTSVAFEVHRTVRLGLLCPCNPTTPAHKWVARRVRRGPAHPRNTPPPRSLAFLFYFIKFVVKAPGACGPAGAGHLRPTSAAVWRSGGLR